jgi:signal transduction histidine kinase
VSALLAAAGWCAAVALLVELRRRSGLLADAAHELRSPLTALSLGIEALRRQPVARRRAEALLAELGRMHAAADDVAAAARGRRAPVRPSPVDLRRLVEHESEAWRPAAGGRGGRVLVDWDAGPGTVRADPRRLSQALGNVLANAVEHGGGEVVVRGRGLPDAIRVEVTDRGQREPATARSRGAARGRGRGLAIAARAIQDAGGRLEWRERPGGGRTVAAELPARRESSAR